MAMTLRPQGSSPPTRAPPDLHIPSPPQQHEMDFSTPRAPPPPTSSGAAKATPATWAPDRGPRPHDSGASSSPAGRGGARWPGRPHCKAEPRPRQSPTGPWATEAPEGRAGPTPTAGWSGALPANLRAALCLSEPPASPRGTGQVSGGHGVPDQLLAPDACPGTELDPTPGAAVGGGGGQGLGPELRGPPLPRPPAGPRPPTCHLPLPAGRSHSCPRRPPRPRLAWQTCPPRLPPRTAELPEHASAIRYPL